MPHTFFADVDQIARNLIAAFKLTFEEKDQNLSDPLLRWLDYRLRYIDIVPRKIVKSIGFNERLPLEAKSALDAFIQKAESGADLNPYLTKSTKRNDSSGVKRQSRTDGLWASWGIHHAHLAEDPYINGEFSDRADWLAFFLASNDQLALIDVRSHGEVDVFQAVDLVEMAIRSFDNWAESFRLKDALGLRHPPAGTAEEVKQLRVAGVNQMLLVDGRVYMPPGFGLTTAATPTLVSLKRNRVRQLATIIGDVFVRPTGEAMESVAKKGVVNALFSLEVLAQGKLAVSCREAALTWPFPSPPIVDDARSELEHWLAPRWAVTKLIQQADIDSYPQ